MQRHLSHLEMEDSRPVRHREVHSYNSPREDSNVMAGFDSCRKYAFSLIDMMSKTFLLFLLFNEFG